MNPAYMIRVARGGARGGLGAAPLVSVFVLLPPLRTGKVLGRIGAKSKSKAW